MIDRATPKQTVGFRLDEAHLDRLRQRADWAGVSVHEYARFLVIEALEGTEIERVRDEVRAAREELLEHHDRFMTAIEALLVAPGSPGGISAEYARSWVEKHLALNGGGADVADRAEA